MASESTARILTLRSPGPTLLPEMIKRAAVFLYEAALSSQEKNVAEQMEVAKAIASNMDIREFEILIHILAACAYYEFAYYKPPQSTLKLSLGSESEKDKWLRSLTLKTPNGSIRRPDGTMDIDGYNMNRAAIERVQAMYHYAGVIPDKWGMRHAIAELRSNVLSKVTEPEKHRAFEKNLEDPIYVRKIARLYATNLIANALTSEGLRLREVGDNLDIIDQLYVLTRAALIMTNQVVVPAGEKARVIDGFAGNMTHLIELARCPEIQAYRPAISLPGSAPEGFGHGGKR